MAEPPSGAAGGAASDVLETVHVRPHSLPDGIMRATDVTIGGECEPAVNVNDSVAKPMLDIAHGRLRSLPDGVMRATDVMIGGKCEACAESAASAAAGVPMAREAARPTPQAIRPRRCLVLTAATCSAMMMAARLR